MTSGDWSDSENDAVVASYFAMLSDELSGRVYNKAANNRALLEQTGRSRGSIEFKMCNLSAVFRGFGLPMVAGYQPRFNFQMSLAEAVSKWLARHPEWEMTLHRPPPRYVAEPEPLFVGTAPTLKNTLPPGEMEQMQHIARHFDVAGRDARNRDLGLAGEERILQHERTILQQHNRADLARRVRWVSAKDGDGAGYDIASFTPDGEDRLIEVKTTNGWERTPFYISRNELAVAEERREHWCLFRLYEFVRTPKAFEVRAPLEAHVSLTATAFQASFQ